MSRKAKEQCSFCLGRARRMLVCSPENIPGKPSYICEECISICLSIIENNRKKLRNEYAALCMGLLMEAS